MSLRNYHILNPTPLEQFADLYNLTIGIHERPTSIKLPRFYVDFEYCDIKEGSHLVGEFGNGNTIEEAMKDYAYRISGKFLIEHPWTVKQRELLVWDLIKLEKESKKKGGAQDVR